MKSHVYSTNCSVFFSRDNFLFARETFQKSARENPKMAVKILEVKNAPENHKKSQKMAKKRARENQKMPVTNFEKVVSRALLGFTGKKKNWGAEGTGSEGKKKGPKGQKPEGQTLDPQH